MSTFTSAQQSAIAARGNVLVVAGAGTGKTRTLIARVLDLLRTGASLDQFLLVTFTEAAAAEMRARLRKALEAEVQAAHAISPPHTSSTPPQTPDASPHPLPLPSAFEEQLALLDTAQISTLHSFCLRLVREHFHHLAIDPQLVILDERQTRPLARDTLTALLAEHYAGRHPHSDAVQALVRRAGRGSDEPLRALVWKLHCYAQSLPDPEQWFAAQLAAFRDPAPTQWETWLTAALAEWRDEWLPTFADAPDVPALKRTQTALAALSPDLVGRAVPSAPPNPPNAQPARWGQTRPTTNALAAALAEIIAADEDWPRGTKTKFREPFKKFFEEAAFFHSQLAPTARAGGLQPPSAAPQTPSPIPHPPSPLAEDWDWSRPAMAALVQLTQQFTARFGEAKRQLGGVDFADLEQFALRLLRDDATGVARACRTQFAHVCVDEYQDINAAQDALLRLVSRAGTDANRFLVGDLKQSIYRFRLADPRIFASYAKAWRSPGRSQREEALTERGVRNAECGMDTSSTAPAASPPSPPLGERAGVRGQTPLAPNSSPTTPAPPPPHPQSLSPGGGEGSPPQAFGSSVLALSENFRSREAVLNFVNPLFRTLMRERVGGVTYDAEAELQFGNPAGRAALRNPVPATCSRRPDASNSSEAFIVTDAHGQRLQTADTHRVELHVLTAATEDAEDEAPSERPAARDLLDLLAVEREACCVALRLRALRAAGHEVWDEESETLRPVAWHDMVVLMRSPGSRVEAFAQEFHRAGVPLHAERGGFYTALEVSDLLNLLRLLDNPLQDLPLLAVLRSPLVALSLEELVAIRAHNDERLFWDALTKFCAAGDASLPRASVLDCGSPLPLSEVSDAQQRQRTGALQDLAEPGAPHSAFAKATAFLARFARWRERIRLGSLTECLERVLAETHYDSLLLAEPRGAERAANVRRLLDLARQFDPYQRQGLHRFLQFIAAQAEADLDHEPAPAPTDDAVRLMSIHQSKGLEFPVVVVAGLGTRFNEQDLRGDILLDEQFGLCPMVSPPGRERRYASLPHWLAARRGRRELLGEELRLLYVAFTRARDTLLLVGTDAGKDAVEKWRTPAEPLTDRALVKARCPLHWLRAWLPSVTAEGDWLHDATGAGGLLRWDFYSADDERLAGSSRREEALAECGVRSAECGMEDSAHSSLSPIGGEGRGEGDSAATSQSQPPPHPNPLPRWGRGDSPWHTDDLAHLPAVLDWRYPHRAATHEPGKTSVTVLRRRAAEADEEAVPWFRPRSAATRPARGELSAAQRGVAHHTFLQCVDLECDATALSLRNEAAQLVETGLLTERDAAGLDFEALLAFWDSAVGRAVRDAAAAGRVQREVPFTARFTVAELTAMGLLKAAENHAADSAVRSPQSAVNQRLLTSSPTPGEEFIIVQGVADLVVFSAKEIWLLDYKTDHVTEAELPAKLHEYGPQLSLYAAALERIHPQSVTRTWLHFLALGRTELL